MAGNIRNKIQFWSMLTSDMIILDYVKGISIDFTCTPPNKRFLKELNLSSQERVMVNNKLQSFIEQEVIEKTLHCKDEYISHIFTRPKKDGGLRIILNLSELNDYVVYEHFKMENLDMALNLIQQGCFLASVDLKDAYFTVSVQEKYRKYLKFYWEGVLYRFTCMPNGLSSAPRIFTKLMKPIFSLLRSRGLSSVFYLDDSLLVGRDFSECLGNVSNTLDILNKAGFTINYEKSRLSPCQEIKFLGFLINTNTMMIRLPEEKINKIISMGERIMCSTYLKIRDLAVFIGNLVASFPAVNHGPLYYRYLEKNKEQSLKDCKGDYDAQMTLTLDAKSEIEWWVTNVTNSKKPIRCPNYDIVINTDASLLGWGAVYSDNKIGGRWTGQESKYHINVLELYAILFALKSFSSLFGSCHVRIRTDSMTAVCYINNMGGIKSMNCHAVAKDIWTFAISNSFIISAEHLPGVNNEIADKESRIFHDDTEWAIELNIFRKICSKLGEVEIDLFASRLNKKCDNYVSWKPDPGACSIDAFCQKWNSQRFYAFPPFCVIMKCLSKIFDDKAEGIIIVPLWFTQAWFPKLLKMLIDTPVILPLNVLYLPYSTKRHPLKEKLRLMACLVSGNSTKAAEFQRKLPQSLSPLGAKVPRLSMQDILKNGIISVVHGKLVPCVLMKS